MELEAVYCGDVDLITRLQSNQVNAWNMIVARWHDRIVHYLARLVKNRADALDLAQGVFMKAYQNIGYLEDPKRFAPWLFSIARNEAFTHFRKTTRPEISLDDAIANKRFEPVGPSRRLLPIELRLALERALSHLSLPQREAVVLKIYEGLTFEEMATLTDCPVSTVKSRLYTALDVLRATLATVPQHIGAEEAEISVL